MTNKHIFLWAGAVIAILLISIFMIMKGAQNYAPRQAQQEVTAYLEEEFEDVQIYSTGEQPFPVFDFYGPEEQALTIEDFSGEYTLLNLWATWCPPCIEELPSLEALSKEMDLNVIALSVDRGKSREELDRFLDQQNIGKVARYSDADQQMIRRYPVAAMPTTLLIDPKGNILYEFVGPSDWTNDEMKKFLKSIVR